MIWFFTICIHDVGEAIDRTEFGVWGQLFAPGKKDSRILKGIWKEADKKIMTNERLLEFYIYKKEHKGNQNRRLVTGKDEIMRPLQTEMR